MIRKKFNEDYFELIDTPEKAYFLGFIFADGCLIDNPKEYRYKLNIKIHNKDEYILKKFISLLDSEVKIWRSNNRDICEIGFSSKKMINDLKNIGLHQNKTYTIYYPKIDEKIERHFLRGYFDGDGCIRINEDKRDHSKRGDLRIVGGSVKFIETLNERMGKLFGVNVNKLYGPKNKRYKFIGWAGMSDIERIYNGFYSDTDLFLTRKKIIFDEVIDIIRDKNKYRKK
jgi:DNA-binding transcriptional regulator WhiA